MLSSKKHLKTLLEPQIQAEFVVHSIHIQPQFSHHPIIIGVIRITIIIGDGDIRIITLVTVTGEEDHFIPNLIINAINKNTPRKVPCWNINQQIIQQNISLEVKSGKDCVKYDNHT